MKHALYILMLLMPTSAAAQAYPKMLLIEGDSCVVFKVSQAKEIIAWDYERERCCSETQICEEQLWVADSIAAIHRLEINEYKQIESNLQEQLELRTEISSLLLDTATMMQKEVRKQKLRKVGVGIAGFISTAFMTYLWIKK